MSLLEYQSNLLLWLLLTCVIYKTASNVVEYNSYHKVSDHGVPSSSFLKMYKNRRLFDCARECFLKPICNFWAFDNKNCFLQVLISYIGYPC